MRSCLAQLHAAARDRAAARDLALLLPETPYMAELEKHWVRELEARFGVRAEFSQRLLPLLRTLAAQQPSPEEWSEMLLAVASAYGVAAPSAGLAGGDETLRLFSQFSVELRKMDESLKVLSACLARVRSQLRRPTPGDPIH